jgi:hypothetical protein
VAKRAAQLLEVGMSQRIHIALSLPPETLRFSLIPNTTRLRTPKQ